VFAGCNVWLCWPGGRGRLRHGTVGTSGTAQVPQVGADYPALVLLGILEWAASLCSAPERGVKAWDD